MDRNNQYIKTKKKKKERKTKTPDPNHKPGCKPTNTHESFKHPLQTRTQPHADHPFMISGSEH